MSEYMENKSIWQTHFIIICVLVNILFYFNIIYICESEKVTP